MIDPSRLQQIWLGIGVLLAAGSLFKLAPSVMNIEGLAGLSIACIVLAYLRFKYLRRMDTPQSMGKMMSLNADDVQKLKPWMYKNIVGQGPSIQSLLQTLKRNVEMVNLNRHLGSYLLVGPTGTGKTFFAKLLAEGLYGRGSLLTMALNQDGLKGERIIEILLTSLKQNPHQVILLDEIDKAAPNVHASLYHFLESGQLMDPLSGEWFHFPATVVIGTTNAGSGNPAAAEAAASSTYGLLEYVASNSTLEKALLSRFEGLYWFGPLSAMDTAMVAILQMMTYYRQHGVEVRFLCPEAITSIVLENRHFKDFGVRQLIQIVRHRSDPLIFQAKSSGWKEVHIVLDSKGAFCATLPKKERKVS